MVIELPYPPSVNGYWRSPNKGPLAGRTLISERGRAYRSIVMAAQKPGIAPPGRLQVHVDAYPPDRRKRDLDNVFKGLLDGLVHAGVIEDDSLIDKLSIHRFAPVAKGLVRVFISEAR
ncbi:RusA family crossover junction endodeoxyribonuclease [Achromobacter sp. KS-M25]|nr:RusA family crossover junction endodeoxyribonuclease [Achromobacter aestuarii]